MNKTSLKKINIKDVCYLLPDLKNTTKSKSTTIAEWFIYWIDNGLKTGQVMPGSLLPSKGEIAYMLGVSTGTVQNALRHIEDLGYVESKQCIGTIIKNNSQRSAVRKLTSKREVAVNMLKRFIKGFAAGEALPSSRLIAETIGFSANTTRLALEHLSAAGILAKDSGWKVKTNNVTPDIISAQETLVKKIENDLKNYITNNLKAGDKMPVHAQLAKELNTSIKTVHDALKALIDEGILLARRGRYGTSVIKMPYDKIYTAKNETSALTQPQQSAFYSYEKARNQIKRMIVQDYEIGSKLPSIAKLSKHLSLSPNTVRKAFGNLAREGYLAFSRGRYGGTFVIDIPEGETDGQSFKWLAVNPQYTELYK